MASVATATTLGKNRAHGSLARPSLVSVGTVVWLSSELMFFAALFAIYFTIRSVNTEWPMAVSAKIPEGVKLDVPFDGAITIILVLSSVTCQLGVIAAEERRLHRAGSIFNIGRWGLREWFILTFIMGAIFVAGQCLEYSKYVSDYQAGENGMTISSSPYGSIFFLATGFHALHVTGGLVAFIFLLLRLSKGRFTPEKITSTIVVSYYWHFVDVVWIGLFSTIFLIQ
ncbi:MAG TPA: heme-copper oxidase subunit III [Acidothermaceae bacterium]|jgi:cytochrome c oxidase subunit 3|nr:heme-copper oxidase subunit III [Acidothermaceae bacterium]